MEISKLSELNGKLKGGFSVLTPKQQEMLRGGADNCDCTNKKRCKVKEDKKGDESFEELD